MAIKKSQLYSMLWESCDALRGGMDPSQYKDYVLTMLFVRYVSDKKKVGDPDLQDIPDDCTFEYFQSLKNTPNIGDDINKALERLADAMELQNAFVNADFNSEDKLGKGKDKVETITALIEVFENKHLDFSTNRAGDDDLIGDAYEYLMRNFATHSGKSKGQFYTPSEVSRLMAKLLDIKSFKGDQINIYDPTCGSGSLLLRAIDEAVGFAGGTGIYGQEKDLATHNMARMNMVLHGHYSYYLEQDDTLNAPQHHSGNVLTTFDYVVANPPFSLKKWMKSAKSHDVYGRWAPLDASLPNLHKSGVPPTSKGDYAFLLHIIRSTKPQGKAACILPHGVLFRGSVEKGEAEATIRKQLVCSHIVSGIIGLPQNLFYGTGIPACIILIDKARAKDSKGIFMIDAKCDPFGKNAFTKDGAKNRLREQDIQRIYDAWTVGRPIDHFCRLVEWDEIERNGYNLNLPRYIQPRNTEIQQDLYAHVHGGLPPVDIQEEFSRLWEVCPSLQKLIFEPCATNNGYMQLTEAARTDLASLILKDKSFLQQHQNAEDAFQQWYNYMEQEVKLLDKGCTPRIVINQWSGQILKEFTQQQSLIDRYDMYDELMKYWNDECMQDDLYLISRDGWTAPVRLPVSKNGKYKGQIKKAFNYDELECDLVPVEILVARYFTKEQTHIDHLQQLVDAEQTAMESIVEQFSDAFDDVPFETINGNYIKEVQALVKSASKKDENLPIWKDFLKHNSEKEKYKKTLSERRKALTIAVCAKYDILTEEDVRTMVFYDKWMPALRNRLYALMTTAQQEIITNITALSERYETTLPELETETAHYRNLVKGYLKEMGIEY